MFTGNTLPQISRPAMYRKGHGYIAPNSPHTAVMSRFISFTSMLHQQQCADTTSSEPSVREAAAAKAPPHTSASPAAVCSYRYYSFAAAALSSTHLQHHFCISLRGASFFIYLIIFNAFSLFIIRAQAQADTLHKMKQPKQPNRL